MESVLVFHFILFIILLFYLSFFKLQNLRRAIFMNELNQKNFIAGGKNNSIVQCISCYSSFSSLLFSLFFFSLFSYIFYFILVVEHKKDDGEGEGGDGLWDIITLLLTPLFLVGSEQLIFATSVGFK